MTLSSHALGSSICLVWSEFRIERLEASGVPVLQSAPSVPVGPAAAGCRVSASHGLLDTSHYPCSGQPSCFGSSEACL